MNRRAYLAAMLSALVPTQGAFAFDWSGSSDVYAQKMWGMTSSDLDPDSPKGLFQATTLGWAYKFGEHGLYLDGLVRSRESQKIEIAPDEATARVKLLGMGMGLGLGWRRNIFSAEAGLVSDTFDLQRPYRQYGGYAHMGLDLYRYSHFLLQANAQMEKLTGKGEAVGGMRLPSRQYVYSAGFSVHADDINSVIPAAVVVTAAIIAACAKGCNLRGVNLGGGGSSRCDHSDDGDCKRRRR